MGVPLQLDRNENLYRPAPKCFEALRNLGIDDLSVYSRDYLRGVKSRLAERLAAELRIPEKQELLSEGSEDMLKQYLMPLVLSGAGFPSATFSLLTCSPQLLSLSE